MNRNFDMQAYQMRTTLIDPKTQKYSLHHGRFRTTKEIFGKQWFKSHIVYAWHNHLTLATFKLLLDIGFCVHHKDKNLLNDNIENLELVKVNKHNSFHHSGKKLSLKTRQKMSEVHKGRIFTLEHRQKLSKVRKKYCGENNPRYRRDLRNNKILNKIKEGKTAQQVAKELSVGEATIYRRLQKLGYEFVGSWKYGRWILRQN